MRAKRMAASDSTEKKYAVEMANARPDEKEKIRERLAKESLRHGKALNHKPSAATLW